MQSKENEAKYPVLPSLSKGVNLAYTKHGEGVRLSFRTLCKYMGEIDEEFYEERFTTQERRCQNYSDEEKKNTMMRVEVPCFEKTFNIFLNV